MLTNHAKVITGWLIITAIGFGAFALSKRSVDNHRYEAMQSRKRMRDSNTVEYEVSERFAKRH